MSNLENNEKQAIQEETSSFSRLLFVVFFVVIVILTVVAGFLKPSAPTPVVTVQTEPEGIMGTECRLGMVFKATDSKSVIQNVAYKTLREVEDQLRIWETATFSNWIDDSEISRLNRGLVDKPSEELSSVLYFAKKANKDTHGAFDVNLRPVIELWKNAAKTGELPTEKQIREVRKQRDTIDLGGISKGYCIYKALRMIMRNANPEGAMVDIGGDVAVYGKSEQGDFWTFSIVNPFDSSKIWGKFRLQTVERWKDVEENVYLIYAVCTSGSYYRGFDIDGVHYSHIIDPRTGKPVYNDTSPASVTVIAYDCMTADIWATALCVMGEDGLQRLPKDVEAYLIFGPPEHPRVVKSKGFPKVTLVK